MTLDAPHTITGEHHPDTSHRAAGRAAGASGCDRRRILNALLVEEMTDEEMQLKLSINPNSQRPRRQELVAMGCVVDSGQRRPGATSPRRAIIWQITDAGREALRRPLTQSQAAQQGRS